MFRDEKVIRCPRCRGIGMAVFDGSAFLIWGRFFNNASIARARLGRIASMLVKGFLVGFAGLGLTFFFFQLMTLIPGGVTLGNIFLTRSAGMLIFALSLVGDMFIVYMFDRELSPENIQSAAREDVHLPTSATITIDQLRKLDPRMLHDVSNVLNEDCVQAMENAWYLAKQWGHDEALPIHLLGALLDTRDVRILLLRMGMMRQDVYTRLRTIYADRIARKQGATPFLGRAIRSLLFDAYAHARDGRRGRIGGADILAVLGKETGLVQQVFEDLNLPPRKIENVAAWVNMWNTFLESIRAFRAKAASKPHGVMNRAMTARETPLLDQSSVDLTDAARRGNSFPLVNRRAEMEDVLRVLSESGANILLVGEVGVGKFALVHGLAMRMVEETVPPALQDKRLLHLDVDSLLALSSGGRLEARLLSLIHEAGVSGNIVLAIRNIGHLVGAGETGSATIDASLVLAQAFTSTGIRVIATATTRDFVGHFQDNPSFLRHFHVIHCDEVSEDIAIQILEMRALLFETQKNILFTYDAVEAAVQLSHQYIHDQVLPEKAIELARETASVVRNRRGKGEFVTREDVASVLSERMHIQVTETGKDEASLLLNLEGKIHERIVGQDEAVDVVANALRRARMKLRDERRPIANFLFLGPTGVGKTELAKTVANVYFGSDDIMIRLDMSEYQEPSSIDRLIGTPTMKGQLTEMVRNSPFSLILLDELEKAHPDIVNIFLEVMDDGRLTDGMGRVIDFTNAMIIATSNAGSSFIQEQLRAGSSVEDIQERLLREQLPKIFRPEFLNRFDSIVVFKPLSFEDVVLITQREINRVALRLAQKGIRLVADDAAIRELAERGFDPTLGARPIRRLVQDHVDNMLAKALLRGNIHRRDVVILEQGGRIRIERAESLTP